MTQSGPSPASGKPAQRPDSPTDQSLGELVQGMSAQISTLVRDEVRLATMELTEKGKKAGIGAGLFGGAGLVALYGVGAFVAAGIIGLANAMSAWLAALIVGGVLFVIAGAAALIGKKEISQATPPTPAHAIAGVKADVAAVKEGVAR